MTLSKGSRLGPYEITAPLGAGGMGEVYLARDGKLDRQVAIKVLPDTMTRDPERVARFEREAKLLASLNHPNIAAIHGFDDANGTRFLVMEFVEGETLAQRLNGGAFAVEDALDIAKQMAEALEAAHEKGVIHRDLKPANVMITAEGKVKVLDFGLAKAMAEDSSTSLSADSPTITANYTRPGVILGTAAYMSPEQARGRPLDKRTDIWSFGCVFYECLTGQRPFDGETMSDTIAKILERDPDFEALPSHTPTKVREVLHRCLEKNRKQRLHDIADARIELDGVLAGRSGTSLGDEKRTYSGQSTWGRALPWVLAMSLSLVVTFTTWRLRAAAPPTDRSIIRLTANLPIQDRFSDQSTIAISPDGTRLAYAASSGGTSHLYLRRLDQLTPKRIEGSDGAIAPFFSPDGDWVGFLGGDKLKKVALGGGSPITLSGGSDLGGCWGPDDDIYFSETITGGLRRMHAAGGTPEVVTTPDPGKNEFAHWWPHLLPGGKALLFTIWTIKMEDAQIALLSLETNEVRTLLRSGAMARYVSTGHLVYAWEHGLMAVAFDLDNLEITGTPVPILEGVEVRPGNGGSRFCASDNGTLAYVSTENSDRTLVWIDRDGRAKPASRIRRRYLAPQLAPGDQRLADTVTTGARMDVWILDLVRDTLNPLTFDGTNQGPVWSPDGRQVAFTSMRDGPFNVYRKDVNGTSEPELLLAGPNDQSVESWSRDGRMLAIRESVPARREDIVLLPMDGDRSTLPFAQTRFNESGAEFSPDGRWIAYVSDESGRPEVYVGQVEEGGAKHLVSLDGGSNPRWSPLGNELFYRSGDKMMAVPVSMEPEFDMGTPEVLFEGRFEAGYDVAADGQRFLMIQADAQAASHINIVLNWFEELKAKVPTGGDR